VKISLNLRDYSRGVRGRRGSRVTLLQLPKRRLTWPNGQFL